MLLDITGITKFAGKKSHGSHIKKKKKNDI